MIEKSMPLKDYYLVKKLWNWAHTNPLITSMNYPLELVAIFSQDVTQFAFQANLSQKNTVDIYSLDESNNYNVNSSLVNHVDYENNDLKASDALFLGWCSSSESTTKPKTKRTHSGGENGDTVARRENYFINGFPQGKIVIYSSTGKHIVNIIQNKREILHADTQGEFIWTLDSEATVKKLQYDQIKPSESFQLDDGKDGEVKLFRVLPRLKGVYLALATGQKLYLLDPSHETLVTVTILDVSDCVGCELIADGQQIAVATIGSVMLFDTSSGEMLQRWDVNVRKIKVMQNIILTLTTEGTIAVFKVGHEQRFGQVQIAHFQVIEFTQVENALLVAWLNVNEPNFKVISLEEINSGTDVVIDDVKGEAEIEKLHDGSENRDKENGLDQGTTSPKKNVSRAEQDELSQLLIDSLDKKDQGGILAGISAETWTEQRIKSFIVFHVNNKERARLIFEAISSNFQHEISNSESSLAEWLKWILTLRNDCVENRHMKKHTKQLRSSLKNSGESLSTLLGIQGRLEMLRNQAQLREDLARLDVTEDYDKIDAVDHEEDAAEDGENQDESISYVNGESDTFVDAAESRN